MDARGGERGERGRSPALLEIDARLEGEKGKGMRKPCFYEERKCW